MTITIQLEGNNWTILEHQAACLGVPVEKYAEVIIQRYLEGRPERDVKVRDDNAFQKAMKDTFLENDELYRRLAK